MDEERFFKIVETEAGLDISDGYHSFYELYNHRHALFIALLLSIRHKQDVTTYWIPDHYESGWDLLVAETSDGQISYHVPSDWRISYQDLLQKRAVSEHVWDGHSSDDVLARLAMFIKRQQEG